MQNCYAIGTFEFVTTNAQKNAVAGETAGGHFVNCYTTLPKMSCDYPMGGTMENSYEGVTAEQAATGELCYKLGDAFRQTIGTDAYPELSETSLPVSYVGEFGYATLYDATTGYTLGGDVKAYAATINKSWLDLKEVANVPASTPVILKGTYYNKLANGALPAINIANDLKGTEAATEADGSMYILAQPEGEEVGFYLATGTIPAGKAYIQSASGVKAFYFDGDNATGINEVNGQRSMVNGQSIYNLAGQRLQKMQRGINIIGNKKILK